MAAQAALRAVEQSGIDPEEIELILLATSSSEMIFHVRPVRSRRPSEP